MDQSPIEISLTTRQLLNTTSVRASSKSTDMAEISIRQNQYIFIFTVATVFYLPLGFVTVRSAFPIKVLFISKLNMFSPSSGCISMIPQILALCAPGQNSGSQSLLLLLRLGSLLVSGIGW